MSKNIIKDIAYENAYEKYGQDLPYEVVERIEHELQLIANNNMEQKYIDIINFANECNKNNILMSTRGCAGCSFILFLCGVTNVNPLEKNYNLQCEFLMGHNGEKEPSIEFLVEKNCKERLDSYAKGNNVIESDLLTVLKQLELLTDVNVQNIVFEESEIIELFQEVTPPFVEQEIINAIKKYSPKNIDEIIKVFGLTLSTGTMEKETDINKIIAFREDVMMDLIFFGINREDSFRYAEMIRKGLGSKILCELKTKKIPNWYLNAVNKIKYLFPKSHTTEYVRNIVYLLWYKKNYPQIFNNITNRKNNKRNFDVCLFFYLDGEFAIHGCKLNESEKYGDCLIYSGGHFDIWDDYYYSKYKVDYDYFPRGRIIYSKSDNKYHILYDKCLEDKIQKITDKYCNEEYVIGYDEHYQCYLCNEDYII